MKIKVKPEDFIVEEVSLFDIKNEPSEYIVYELNKKNIDMFYLINELSNKYHILKKDISFAGIKDKYGDTSQLITIKNIYKIPNKIENENFLLKLKGYSEKSIDAKSIIGNKFIITLRDLNKNDLYIIKKNLDNIIKYGIPNYFDNQRFGSSRHRKGFFGKEIFLGNREKALKLYFEPSEFDSGKLKYFKKEVLANWRKWKNIKNEFNNDYGKIIKFLSQKGNSTSFTKALSFIDKNLLIIMIRAYSSYLFNNIIIKYLNYLENNFYINIKSIPYYAGNLIFYEKLPDSILNELLKTELPEPAYDTIVNNELINKLLNEVLEEENIQLSQLKVKKIYGANIHSKMRKMIVIPEELEIIEINNDELYKNKNKIKIKFFLPKGSYATIVIKRIGIEF